MLSRWGAHMRYMNTRFVKVVILVLAFISFFMFLTCCDIVEKAPNKSMLQQGTEDEISKNEDNNYADSDNNEEDEAVVLANKEWVPIEGYWFTKDNNGAYVVTNNHNYDKTTLKMSQKEEITTLIFDLNVHLISKAAFENCKNLKTVIIKCSDQGGIIEIQNGAFSGCDSLQEIHYDGDSSSWEKICIEPGNEHLVNAKINCYNVDFGILDSGVIWGIVDETLIFSGQGAIEEKRFSMYSPPWINGYNITEIIIPEGITSIGEKAFRYLPDVETINIPDSVESIGEEAFAELRLKSIKLGKNIKSIGARAFRHCSTLESIVIPDSVNYISEDAFMGCGFTSVTIGKGIKKIEVNAFQYCDNLERVYISDLEKWCDIEFCTYFSENTQQTECCSNPLWNRAELYLDDKLVKELVIPNKCTLLKPAVFAGCSSIESVTISSEVTKIETAAFSNCVNLCSVNMADGVTSIGTNAFALCRALETIELPSTVKSIGKATFGLCEKLSNVSIGKNVTNIDDKAFWLCEELKSITIPQSVTHIGNGVFSSCRKLNSILVDEDNLDYSSIDGVLFNKNKTELVAYPIGKIESVYNIPNGVVNIREYAFYDSENLTSITIPNGVVSICEYAFFSCDGITSITLPNTVEKIGRASFYDCKSLNFVKMSECILSIEDVAFVGCDLKTITLPNSIKTIGRCALPFDIVFRGTKEQWAAIDKWDSSLSANCIGI